MTFEQVCAALVQHGFALTIHEADDQTDAEAQIGDRLYVQWAPYAGGAVVNVWNFGQKSVMWHFPVRNQPGDVLDDVQQALDCNNDDELEALVKSRHRK